MKENRKRKRLTRDEIDTAVDKIREEYQDYIIRYTKPLSVISGFEERYLQALRNKMDMETFLHAEISAVRQLSSQEAENRRQKEEKIRNAPRKKKRAQKIGFADRVLKELEEKVKKYPSVDFHPSAPEELKRLCGVIGEFERDGLFECEGVLRNHSSDFKAEDFHRIERVVSGFLSRKKGEVPPRMERYAGMLDRKEEDSDEGDMERKRILFDGAKIFHYFADALKAVQREVSLTEEERKKVEKNVIFVHNVLRDFRLKDLKL